MESMSPGRIGRYNRKSGICKWKFSLFNLWILINKLSLLFGVTKMQIIHFSSLLLVDGAGYWSLSMKVFKFCIVQAVLLWSGDELVWQAGWHRERVLLPGAVGGWSDQIQVINWPDLTGNTLYFKYFTRDTKFGNRPPFLQEQGVSAVTPSQELVSFLPHVCLEDPRVASGSKGSPGSELAAVVWRRAVRSSRLHLCTMSHLWRCTRMVFNIVVGCTIRAAFGGL